MAARDQTTCERVRRYREMAEAATANAARSRDAEVQRAFLSLAESWQRLADDVEMMEKLQMLDKTGDPVSSS